MIKAIGTMSILAAALACVCIAGTARADKEKSSEMMMHADMIVVKGEGMKCPMCALEIQKRLRKLKGVTEVTAQVATQTVHIQMKSGKDVSDEKLRKALKEAGFTPTDIHRPGAHPKDHGATSRPATQPATQPAAKPAATHKAHD